MEVKKKMKIKPMKPKSKTCKRFLLHAKLRKRWIKTLIIA